MKYLWTLMLFVLCLGAIALGQEVVAEEAAEGQPLWVILLPAIVAAVVAVLQNMGKKDALKKLKGAIEVGRTVFAAIEECEAVGPKKLVRRAMADAATSDEAKEINNLLHSVTDFKAAEKIPPIKRFWRRMLRGQNLAGVAARVAMNNAISGLINKEDE